MLPDYWGTKNNFIINNKKKGKSRTMICLRRYTAPRQSALEGGGWSAQRSGRFTSRKDTVLLVREAGSASGVI
jgi:hypothetical protein